MLHYSYASSWQFFFIPLVSRGLHSYHLQNLSCELFVGFLLWVCIEDLNIMSCRLLFLFLQLNIEIFLEQTTSMDFHGWDNITQVMRQYKIGLPLVQLRKIWKNMGVCDCYASWSSLSLESNFHNFLVFCNFYIYFQIIFEARLSFELEIPCNA